MFAETMAGIAVVKKAAEMIKSSIDTANDIGSIAGYVDNLFTGQQQIIKKRNAKAGVSSLSYTKNIAQEMIDAKLAEETMNEMRNIIDLRFGHGTWKSIIDERAKRIQEEKDAIHEMKKEQRRRSDELAKTVKEVFIVVMAILLGSLTIGAAIYFGS